MRTPVIFLLFVFIILFTADAFAQQSVSARNRYKVAKNMFSSGRYQEAEKELTESLKLDGRYSDALFLMGLTKWQLKEYDESVKYLEQVIRQEPKFFTARLYLATVCLEKNDLSRAEEQAKFYMTNATSDPNGYYAMGVISYKKGDLPKSLEFWDKAISLDKNHASSYYNKALVLYLQGKTQESIASIDKALAVKTANLNLYRFSKACINYFSGDKDEAIKEFSYLSELIPSTVIGLTSASMLALHESRWQDAINKADDALSIDPLFQKALEVKAAALENSGDIGGAVTCLETIVKNDPNQKYVSEKLASLKIRGNEKTEETEKTENTENTENTEESN